MCPNACSVHYLHCDAVLRDGGHAAHLLANSDPWGDEAVQSVRVARTHPDAPGAALHVAARRRLHRRRAFALLLNISLHRSSPSHSPLVLHTVHLSGYYYVLLCCFRHCWYPTILLLSSLVDSGSQAYRHVPVSGRSQAWRCYKWYQRRLFSLMD